ncbi:MAG: hypothetical protein ACLFV2_11665 [Desulfurivibrionaceae bacterium]
MTLPIMTIAHSLPGRVRIHFSIPPREFDTLRQKLLQDARILEMSWSPVSKTCVIYYDHKKIELLHILKMIAIFLADEYQRQPIYVCPNEDYRFSTLTLLSAVSIVFAAVARFTAIDLQIGRLLGLAAVGTTAASVVEHAYIEIERTGNFDPDALSIVYLINSTRKGEYVQGAFFTWLVSFSRHLVQLPYLGGLKMTIIDGFDEIKKQKYLDVVTSGSISMSSLEGQRFLNHKSTS